MKKLALTALFGLLSTAAFAAPVGSTFTGFGTGIDLTSTKYEGYKRATGVGVVVDYGMDYGHNLVGLVEGKVKFNSSKLQDSSSGSSSSEVKEKWRAGVSYLQGYRVLPDLLPYVKVGYTVAKAEAKVSNTAPASRYQRSVTDTGNGLGVGAGVKYAVSSNFELGAEYLRSRAKIDGDSVNANTVGANATYRF